MKLSQTIKGAIILQSTYIDTVSTRISSISFVTISARCCSVPLSKGISSSVFISLGTGGCQTYNVWHYMQDLFRELWSSGLQWHVSLYVSAAFARVAREGGSRIYTTWQLDRYQRKGLDNTMPATIITFTWSHDKMMDATLEQSVANSDIVVWFRSELPQCTNAHSSSLSILTEWCCHGIKWHIPLLFLVAYRRKSQIRPHLTAASPTNRPQYPRS